MHPQAVTSGVELRTVRAELEQGTARAAAEGVTDVPAVSVAGRVWVGERELEQAATYAHELLAGAGA
jgi:hypothetical protein